MTERPRILTRLPYRTITTGYPIDDGWYVLMDSRAEVHAVPYYAGEKMHAADPGCWCSPFLDHKVLRAGAVLWIHRRPH